MSPSAHCRGRHVHGSGPQVPNRRHIARYVGSPRCRYLEAAIIGFFQTFALLAGISRSGISMVGGLARGLSHRDAARFSFLLATPVILAAGVLKLPTLAGAGGSHIHGQVLLGAVLAGVASYVSVRWLTRWFETKHAHAVRDLQPGARRSSASWCSPDASARLVVVGVYDRVALAAREQRPVDRHGDHKGNHQ